MSKCFTCLLAGILAQSMCVVAIGQSVQTTTALSTSGHVAGSSDDQKHAEFFERKILPVLVSRCYECHSEEAAELEGGLRLDSRVGVRRGGDSGPAVVPGSESQSLLLTAITSKDNPMPPDEPLDAEVVADFRSWIVAGAVDPRDAAEELPLREPDYSEARQVLGLSAGRATIRPASWRPGMVHVANRQLYSRKA